jgi:hypothetical protein
VQRIVENDANGDASPETSAGDEPPAEEKP